MSEHIKWASEYDELMTALQSHWKAGITKPPKAASIPDFDPGTAFYPRAVATMKGRVVEVAGPLAIKVSIRVHLRMQISREDIFERIASKLGVLREIETGVEEFDAKYFLRWDIGDASHLEKSSEFRELIDSIEPFDSIDIFRSKLRCYRTIENKEQLGFQSVDQLANQLVSLAEIVDPQPTG